VGPPHPRRRPQGRLHFELPWTRTDDYVPGIYTFGTIGSTQELIYAPQYNYFRPAVAPNATRLTLPAGATSIASALNSNGDTALFVAGTGGLYLFTPDNQGDQSSPVLAVPSSIIANNNILAGASSLSASTTGSRTVVWGVNVQGDLFHVYCPAGSEATASAWSSPIPLCSGVEGFAFYLNISASNNVLFAHLSGQQLLQLTQDPATSTWTQRSILLPPTSIDDMIEYNSFTSHICTTDDNGIPVPNIPVTLTSTSPVTMYINDVYHVLSPTVPVNATSDVTGTVTIIQETQTLSAVCFQITITGPPSVVAKIDPLSKAIQTLSTIQTGDDLSGVQIKTASGVQQSLVPSSVPPAAKNAAAQSIVNLIKVKDTLPPDGSTKTTPSAAPAAVSHVMSTAEPTQPKKVWGVSFKNGVTYHEGDDVAKHIGVPAVGKALALKTVSLDIAQTIAIAAGDLFNFLKSAWADVESFVVQEVEGFYHFCATIGNKIYNAILDCVSAVVGAVEFVFNQIEVFFEQLIAWLGYLFDWDDIKRTHSVMKNILKQYGNKLVSSIDSLETSIENAFIDLENQINAWAGVTDPGETIGTHQQAGSSVPGSNSPQANWALNHTKNGILSSETSYTEPDTGSSALDQILQDLGALVTNEEDYIKTTITQIQDQVANQISSLTPLQVIKKVMGIASDLILKSARILIVKLVDIIKIMITGLLDFLDAPLDIPILSSIYKSITGDQLTFLDLITLIGAIPATILYKLVSGQTPFPDNSHTQALINAPDFTTLGSLLTGTSTLSTAQKQSLSTVHSAMKIAPVVRMASVDIANVVLNMGALVGSALVVVCAFEKRYTEDLIPSQSIRIIAASSYLLYVGPDIIGAFYTPAAWYVALNDTITGIATLKTWADNTVYLSKLESWNDTASPILETIINVVWLTTAIGPIASNKSPQDSDWLSMAANLCFDIGGALTVATMKSVPKPYGDIAFLVCQDLTLMYGFLSVAVGRALIG
jgi:hypothetical protein